MTTYSISLDDVDLALLPIPTYSCNNFLKKQHYQFQVMKTGLDDITATAQVTTPEPTILYTCHICSIDVPAAFASEHTTSQKHRANVRIASVAAERMRAFISTLPPPHAARSSARFCTNCSKEVDENHEKTNEHRAAVMLDRLLCDLMKAYVQDHDESKYQESSSNQTDGNNKKCIINNNLQKEDNFKYVEGNTNSKDMDDIVLNNNQPTKLVEENVEQEGKQIENKCETKDSSEKSSEDNSNNSNSNNNISKTEDNANREYILYRDKEHYGEELRKLINDTDFFQYKEFTKISIQFNDNIISNIDSDHYHSYDRACKNGSFNCIVCDCVIKDEDAEAHKYDLKHMRRVTNLGKDGHYMREINEFYSHCILCNLKIENIDLVTHKESANHSVKEYLYTNTRSGNVPKEHREDKIPGVRLEEHNENEEQPDSLDEYSENGESKDDMEECNEIAEPNESTHNDSCCFIVTVDDDSEEYSENEESYDSRKKDCDDKDPNDNLEEQEDIIYIPEESYENEELSDNQEKPSEDEESDNNWEEYSENEESTYNPKEGNENEEPDDDSESEENIVHEELSNKPENEDEELTDDITEDIMISTNQTKANHVAVTMNSNDVISKTDTRTTKPIEDKIEETQDKIKRNVVKFDLQKYGEELRKYIDNKDSFEFKETFIMVQIKSKENNLYTYSDRFHSYDRMRDKGTVKCIVCDCTFNKEDSEDHKFDTEHMRKIANLGKDGHYIRQIDETYSHCILCNLKIENLNVAAHKDLLSHNFGIRLFTRTTNKKVNEGFTTASEDTKIEYSPTISNQSIKDCDCDSNCEPENHNSDKVKVEIGCNDDTDNMCIDKFNSSNVSKDFKQYLVTTNSVKIEKGNEVIENNTNSAEPKNAVDGLETNEQNANNYIQDYEDELRKLIDSKCDFEFYEISNTIRIRMNDDILHIYNDHFHSFDRKYFSGRLKCIVCDCILKFEDANDHKYDFKHMSRIINMGNDRHYVRKIDESYSHCILCNLKIKNENLDTHKQLLMHTIKKDLYTSNAGDKKKEITTAKASIKINDDRVPSEKNTTNEIVTTIKSIDVTVGSKSEYPYKETGMGHVRCVVCDCNVPSGVRSREEHVQGWRHRHMVWYRYA